jgi:hypothetical protein
LSRPGTRGGRDLDPRSDRQGQLIERDGHPPFRWLVNRQLVVSASKVLHKRMPDDDHPGAAVLLEAAHRSQPRLEPTMVGLDPVVDVAERRYHRTATTITSDGKPKPAKPDGAGSDERDWWAVVMRESHRRTSGPTQRSRACGSTVLRDFGSAERLDRKFDLSVWRKSGWSGSESGYLLVLRPRLVDLTHEGASPRGGT